MSLELDHVRLADGVVHVQADASVTSMMFQYRPGVGDEVVRLEPADRHAHRQASGRTVMCRETLK